MRCTGLMIAGCAGLVACASSGTSSSASGSAAAVAPLGTTYVATLLPTNASGNRIAGKIRLLPSARADEVIADIDLRGSAYQNKHAWVVRSGQCGEDGQDLGTAMSYRVIETRGDGMAQMKVPVRIAIPAGRVHHVAIFADAMNRRLIVSCGVLSPET